MPEMDALYQNAACVVYPSTYEGFGLPVVEALARNQTVYVRDTPLNRWIGTHWNGPGQLIFFITLNELAERIRMAEPVQERQNQSAEHIRPEQPNGKSWNDMARKIMNLLSEMADDTSNAQFWRRLNQEHYLSTYAEYQDQNKHRHVRKRSGPRRKPTFLEFTRRLPMEILREIRRFYRRQWQ